MSTFETVDHEVSLWNPPTTAPDDAGVYEVMIGAAPWSFSIKGFVFSGYTEMVGCSHWDGSRWGQITEGKAVFSQHYVKHERGFNPRQDYPWREIP